MEMKKLWIAATALLIGLSFAAPAAWAGHAAKIEQFGDRNVTMIIQKKEKTVTRSWTIPEKPVGHVALGLNPHPAAYIKMPIAKARAVSGLRKACNAAPAGPNFASVGQAGGQNQVSITQRGTNNHAYATQTGNNNKSRIVQRGTGHLAETVQTGNNNTAIIIQKC
jgi:hypothetical protein